MYFMLTISVNVYNAEYCSEDLQKCSQLVKMLTCTCWKCSQRLKMLTTIENAHNSRKCSHSLKMLTTSESIETRTKNGDKIYRRNSMRGGGELLTQNWGLYSALWAYARLVRVSVGSVVSDFKNCISNVVRVLWVVSML